MGQIKCHTNIFHRRLFETQVYNRREIYMKIISKYERYCLTDIKFRV